jgi:metal-responsive CopG/Arc/MetJ family transcriptional regulator
MIKKNRTRSELMKEPLRRYILEEEWAEIYRYGEQKAVQEDITEDQIEDIIDAQRIQNPPT